MWLSGVVELSDAFPDAVMFCVIGSRLRRHCSGDVYPFCAVQSVFSDVGSRPWSSDVKGGVLCTCTDVFSFLGGVNLASASGLECDDVGSATESRRCFFAH
jgi:hypothetical protein